MAGATRVIDKLFTVLIIGAGLALVCIPIAVECQSVEAVRIAAGSALTLITTAQIVKLIGLADVAIKFWRAPKLSKSRLR